MRIAHPRAQSRAAAFPGDSVTEACDLCRSPSLQMLYRPEASARGLSVWLCTECGLLQSLPRADRGGRQEAAGTDWNNVHYGKGVRTEDCLSMLRALTDFRRPLSVLDVGSSRGDFARALVAEAPAAALTCVEPDGRMAQSCATLERAEIMQMQI